MSAIVPVLFITPGIDDGFAVLVESGQPLSVEAMGAAIAEYVTSRERSASDRARVVLWCMYTATLPLLQQAWDVALGVDGTP